MSAVEIQKVRVTFTVETLGGEVLRTADVSAHLVMDLPDAPSELAKFLTNIALEDAPKFFKEES